MKVTVFYKKQGMYVSSLKKGKYEMQFMANVFEGFWEPKW